MKEQDKSSEKELNEMQANNFSEIEFKVMVMRMLKELSKNYKEPRGNYNGMKKEIETMNNNQSEMKNTISDIKNTLEGIKSTGILNEADFEDKIEKTPNQINKEKIKKQKHSLRELWDSMKPNSICIIGVLEEEESEQGLGNLFKEIIRKLLKRGKEKSYTSLGSTETQSK